MKSPRLFFIPKHPRLGPAPLLAEGAQTLLYTNCSKRKLFRLHECEQGFAEVQTFAICALTRSVLSKAVFDGRLECERLETVAYAPSSSASKSGEPGGRDFPRLFTPPNLAHPATECVFELMVSWGNEDAQGIARARVDSLQRNEKSTQRFGVVSS